MYAAIAKNGEPINGIKAGNRVVVFAGWFRYHERGGRASPLPKNRAITREENARNRVKGTATRVTGIVHRR